MTMREAIDMPLSFAGMFYASPAWKRRQQEREADETYRRALVERLNMLIGSRR